MVRSLIKVTVIPYMLGILFFPFPVEKTYDFSKYLLKDIALDFTVPLAEEVIEVPFNYQPIPLILKNYTGFKEALAFRESRGNYIVVNSFGYMGKYQFGQATLDLLGIDKSIKFLENPNLQEQAFILNASRNKWVLRRDIKRYANKWIGGVHITESGIIAAAHLAGPGNVKKFLRSGGQIGFEDGFSTSIQSYLKKFAGYDVSNIKSIRRPSLKRIGELYTNDKLLSKDKG